MFILGYKLPVKGTLYVKLLYCFGLNATSSLKIVSKLGINMNDKLSYSKLKYINFENFLVLVIKRVVKRVVGLILKNVLHTKMKELRFLKTKKSFCHTSFLPVRGQRTKNNAQTQKAKRKDRRRTPIAKKKK